MMNIPSLGSKESLGVKFREVKCAELCLKFWFKATGIFIILLSQKATVRKESPKQTLAKVDSEAAVRRCSSN